MNRFKATQILYSIFFIAVLGLNQVNAQNSISEKAKKYIADHAHLAMVEQVRSGVPATITLSQGLYETGNGESVLCTKGNNHFGIKCKKDWAGETISHTDDAPDECFRKYSSVQDSYRDHSDFLLKNKRYAGLFENDVNDYKAWCKGLKKAGYATNPAYAHKLIDIIERYELQQYTTMASKMQLNGEGTYVAEVVPTNDALVASTNTNNVYAMAPKSKQQIKDELDPDSNAGKKEGVVVTVNNLKAVWCTKGTALLDIAIQHKIRYAKLLSMNDLKDAPLPQDMYVYLERKASKSIRKTHTVKTDENLLGIAQAEGIQLKYLLAYNNLTPKSQPAVGTVLNLQELTSKQPEVVTNTEGEKNKKGKVEKVQKSDEYIATGNKKPAHIEVEKNTEEKKQTKKAIEEIKTVKTDTTKEEVEKKTTEEATAEVEKITEPVPDWATKVAIKTEETQEEENPQEVTIAPQEPVRQNLPTRRRRHKQTKEQKANQPFNIANEMAVEEKPAMSNPRFVEVEDEELENQQVSTRRIPKQVITQYDEDGRKIEKDKTKELSILKAKLDKVVYASAELSKENKEKSIAEPEAAQGEPVYHIVKEGETAFKIAQDHNISISELNEWNQLNFSEIKVGQKLIVKP